MLAWSECNSPCRKKIQIILTTVKNLNQENNLFKRTIDRQGQKILRDLSQHLHSLLIWETPGHDPQVQGTKRRNCANFRKFHPSLNFPSQ